MVELVSTHSGLGAAVLGPIAHCCNRRALPPLTSAAGPPPDAAAGAGSEVGHAEAAAADGDAARPVVANAHFCNRSALSPLMSAAGSALSTLKSAAGPPPDAAASASAAAAHAAAAASDGGDAARTAVPGFSPNALLWVLSGVPMRLVVAVVVVAGVPAVVLVSASDIGPSSGTACLAGVAFVALVHRRRRAPTATPSPKHVAAAAAAAMASAHSDEASRTGVAAEAAERVTSAEACSSSFSSSFRCASSSICRCNLRTAVCQ
mmetsp:Transcript_56119/g.144828  ORF Transcript_56119/g.144828 Transcript_56119/m.144828 type:complete len:263 (-) Transcript_56119:263-1051(-)